MNDKKNILQQTPFPSYHLIIILDINLFNNWIRYHTISLGFIFLTIDNISGAVWANEA